MKRTLAALSVIVLSAASSGLWNGAQAADNPTVGLRLTVSDTTLKNGRATVKVVTKDSVGIEKGPSGDPAQLSGTLELLYNDLSSSGTLTMPAPWDLNVDNIALFANPASPDGPTVVRSAKVKPNKSASVKARGLGGFDISSPPPPSGVTVVLTINNAIDGTVHRMCSRYSAVDGSRIRHKVGAGPTYKLKMTKGVGSPTCGSACADGAQNGDESDVDCGGSCPDCPDGGACNSGSDCVSGVCSGGVCQAPTCSDGVQNGTETGLDCGDTCPPCPAGQGCVTGADCQTGVCTGGICAAGTCTDGVQNQDESDVDCGGVCGGCPDGGACGAGSDCQSGVCTGGVCQVPTCTDGVENQDETDTDCGGATCPSCPDGSDCVVASDCQNGVCVGGICFPANCGDLIQNGDESDVDCGGSCSACPDGGACGVGADCESSVCILSVCLTPDCSDGVKNGFETDVDCGGVCPDCADGLECLYNQDCASGFCDGNTCATPTCTDAVKNPGRDGRRLRRGELPDVFERRRLLRERRLHEQLLQRRCVPPADLRRPHAERRRDRRRLRRIL